MGQGPPGHGHRQLRPARHVRAGATTTLSLTAYLHASAEELAALADDFILIECEGRVGGGGASDERSSYWSRDGRLLATSEQLAWYRQAPPVSPE